MKKIIEKAEAFLELGGFKKDIAFLVFSGLSLIISLFDLLPLPFDAAWVAIILCGVPIIMEAIIGLITAFDIKPTCWYLWRLLPLSASARILPQAKWLSSCSWARCWRI